MTSSLLHKPDFISSGPNTEQILTLFCHTHLNNHVMESKTPFTIPNVEIKTIKANLLHSSVYATPYSMTASVRMTIIPKNVFIEKVKQVWRVN